MPIRSPAPAAVRRHPLEERPRERLLRRGAPVLSDAELLAVLLGEDALTSTLVEALEVLDGCGGLVGLLSASQATLRRSGLCRTRTATLLGAVELARRLARTRIPEREVLQRTDAVADYLALRYGSCDQEVMGALFLDVRSRLIADVDLYRGTLSRSAVEPRLIFKEALEHSASAVIVFHTHPSGDPAPSAEDLVFTRRLADVGKLVGVRLADHLILGGAGRWVSLQRRGAW